MKKNIIIIFVLGLLTSLAAETSLSLDMRFMQSLYRGADNKLYSQPAGTVEMTMRSAGNSDVKADLMIDYIPMNAPPGGMALPLFDLKKASVKLRFPGLRITMGKTRVGWGEGSVFNSGAVLFGSLSPLVDLTQDEARTDTAWLTLLRWSPSGDFWVEGIYMPPTPSWDISIDNDADDVTPEYFSLNNSVPDVYSSSAGLRMVGELGDLIVETGYLAKGELKALGDVTGHRPYITLHGEMYFDLYGSASMAIPWQDFDWDTDRGSFNISAGLFRQFQLWYDGTLSARMEFLVFPYQKWEEQDFRLNPLANETYSLYLYPEFNLAIGRNLNIPLMAMISPLDQSAQITAGFSWKVYQGFSFLGYGIFSVGQSKDVFAWDRLSSDLMVGDVINGWSVMTGLRYTF
ncbi:MAG: hypothetical protein PF447_05050 [Spirochaetaceae bacterium]|jgi:hypothetical protein|nr:hypothetical protein [Spirochaetaceae bacterium]